jgi:hypothetical protein
MTHEVPFASPFYWIGFICQGIGWHKEVDPQKNTM